MNSSSKFVTELHKKRNRHVQQVCVEFGHIEQIISNISKFFDVGIFESYCGIFDSFICVVDYIDQNIMLFKTDPLVAATSSLKFYYNQRDKSLYDKHKFKKIPLKLFEELKECIEFVLENSASTSDFYYNLYVKIGNWLYKVQFYFDLKSLYPSTKKGRTFASYIESTEFDIWEFWENVHEDDDEDESNITLISSKRKRTSRFIEVPCYQDEYVDEVSEEEEEEPNPSIKQLKLTNQQIKINIP